jgi:hypothetical protein
MITYKEVRTLLLKHHKNGHAKCKSGINCPCQATQEALGINGVMNCGKAACRSRKCIEAFIDKINEKTN